MSKLKELKERVEFVTQVSIDTKARQRAIVYAKKLFCYIARERGHTFDAIGKAINHHHATIIFHNQDTEWLLKNDKDFYNKYLRIVGKPESGVNSRDMFDLYVGRYARFNH